MRVHCPILLSKGVHPTLLNATLSTQPIYYLPLLHARTKIIDGFDTFSVIFMDWPQRQKLNSPIELGLPQETFEGWRVENHRHQSAHQCPPCQMALAFLPKKGNSLRKLKGKI